MSDVNPEQYAEYTTQDGPGSDDADAMNEVPLPLEDARADTDPRTGAERKPEPDRAQGAH